MSSVHKNDETYYDEFVNESKKVDHAFMKDVHNVVDYSEKENNKVMKDLRNLCHYSCSKINLSNILLVIVIIILLVLLFKK